MATFQLILIDDKTGQPKLVQTFTDHLDMSSPIQRNVYVNTINALSANTEVTSTVDGTTLTINMNTSVTLPPSTDITVDVYEPEEEED